MFRYSKRIGRDPEKVEILAKEYGYVGKRIMGLNRLIFVNNMSDTFHIDIPFEILDVWFNAFQNFPDKTFQILTKRPARAVQYFQYRGSVPENCWIGTSCGIAQAKHRLDLLRLIKAKVRFVSFEPLLEDLGELNLEGIHQAIIGGESDFKNPRPMKPEWALNIIKQCKEQKVAIFYKQLGGIGGDNAGGNICPCCQTTHQEFPSSA